MHGSRQLTSLHVVLINTFMRRKIQVYVSELLQTNVAHLYRIYRRL